MILTLGVVADYGTDILCDLDIRGSEWIGVTDSYSSNVKHR